MLPKFSSGLKTPCLSFLSLSLSLLKLHIGAFLYLLEPPQQLASLLHFRSPRYVALISISSLYFVPPLPPTCQLSQQTLEGPFLIQVCTPVHTWASHLALARASYLTSLCPIFLVQEMQVIIPPCLPCRSFSDPTIIDWGPNLPH